MNHFILALTGPAGSGKTTVGERLAKQFEKCVNIDADHVKHMIVSGFYVDKDNPENPSGWNFNQWSLVGDSIGLLADNFAKAGYDVIINGYIDEPGWSNIEKHIALSHKIILLPDLVSSVSRDAGRNADSVMGEVAVAKHHETFSNDTFYADFIKVNTSDLTVDETVQKVKSLLA